MSTPEISAAESGLGSEPGLRMSELEARIAELREEAKTATPERRTEIGWWIFGARKHMGRQMDANLARQYGEHRCVIHRLEGRRIWAVCSCGAEFPGQMHEDFTPEQFTLLDGHQPLPSPWTSGTGAKEAADEG